MIHVCYGLYDKNGTYSKFTGTSICSMFENHIVGGGGITVHLLHDNTLTEDNRDKFKILADNYHQQIKFYNVEETCADKIAEMRRLLPAIENARVSIGALYSLLVRYVIPEDVKKIIYIDGDTIVNLDIEEFYNIEFENECPVAGVTEIVNGMIPKLGLPMCRDGFVKDEDYFNAGVIFMNLERLRKEDATIMNSIKFRASHPEYIHFDQDIWNYAFSKQALKLPTKFNCFVRYKRQLYQNEIEKNIYHYLGSGYGQGLTMDLSDNFNKLWFEYFTKTPWFNAEAVKHALEVSRQIYVEQKSFALYVSAMMSGKTRAFYVSPQNFAGVKQIFSVREDEEIILADSQESIKKLLKSLKKSKHKKVFFIMLESPEILQVVGAELLKAGFVENKDFINAMNFLSDIHGVPFNSFTLINAM